MDPGEFAALTDSALLFNQPATETPAPPPDGEVFIETPLFDAIPNKVGHHAATIAAFDDGELLAAWYSYAGPNELDGSAIYMTRRPAGSDDWETPWLHIDRDVDDGNPVLYVEGDEVWLFQAVIPWGWGTTHIETQRSADRGWTWTPPEVVHGPLGANTRYRPIRLFDGRLLLPAYDGLLHRALFFISTDGSRWRLHGIIDTGLAERATQPAVVQLATGRLLAVMRNTAGGWLWVTASDDLGRTWTRPADSGFANPDSAAALARLDDGNLLLVFNDSPTDRTNLTVALSADEGRNWPYRRVLAADDEKRSYPSVAQSPDGRIHIVYTLSRRSIQHVTVNEAWVMGSASGTVP